MSSTNSALKLRELALRTPRPYTSKIALNGTLRPQTKLVDKQVQKSFSRGKSGGQYTVKPQPRDGETGGNDGGKGKSREDELAIGFYTVLIMLFDRRRDAVVRYSMSNHEEELSHPPARLPTRLSNPLSSACLPLD
ncbi:hypothetical protein M409DRAFT_57045 [Zasmidium cellare ATCC 36951]|uniref:Uncharacterized protein n=1 Tax=Zasmidium cellare ATCC 36951 TaxID=1080233 RepID=A0A6A6CCM8_ZASCE|nr:uncharacterized protein M409DRAFT_57045 [Zasmidium cellare ATCC 36951]KAF2163938.1 hypothetical protein M409DRAFT_57045 [Zasmidium cellare ATCC 36951]